MLATAERIRYEPGVLERITINRKMTYLTPSKYAQASFLGCSGLLIQDAKVVLLDGNMGPWETKELLTSTRPDMCIITHYHGDHSRYGAEAVEFSDATVYVPEEERRYLIDLDYFVQRCGIEEEDLARIWLKWLTEKLKLKPIPSAVPLSGHDVIDAGSVQLEVIPAPGHSPGHQTYWEARERLLFCTDIGVDTFGPWYGWKDADLADYIQSIHRLIALDARLLVTSHGGVISENVRGALERCLDVIRAREAQILRDLDAGLDAAAVARAGHIYGNVLRFPPPLDRAYAIWERYMVDQHLHVLDKGGVDAI